jgi:hypothetical protein
MVRDVPGLIIAYDSMTGVVLLKSNSARGLEVVAKRYVESNCDQGFWFAKFMWSAIDDRDKKQIQASIGDRLIRDVIVGCKVSVR